MLQNWRDHARWGVRELIVHLSAFYDRPHDPDELLAAVGLTEQAGQQITRLSGGQRRRLDVALGIVGGPRCSSWTSRRPASTRRRAGSSTG
nr:hypothetical protein GCM10020093_045740 [Planobispora longispora]